MLLQSILDMLTQKLARQNPVKAEPAATLPEMTPERRTFADTIHELQTPASEATVEAAAKAEGINKIELEIAADHLSRPVHREEVVQVVTGDSQPLR